MDTVFSKVFVLLFLVNSIACNVTVENTSTETASTENVNPEVVFVTEESRMESTEYTSTEAATTEKPKRIHLVDVLSVIGNRVMDKCPDLFNRDIWSELSTFYDCYKKVDRTLTVCEGINWVLKNCTRPIVEAAEQCLPEQTKAWPSLFVRSCLLLGRHLCTLQGDSIFEIANPCIWDTWDRLLYNDTSSQFYECEKKAISPLMPFMEEGIPRVEDVCGVTNDVRKCLNRAVPNICPNVKTQNFIMGIYDALVDPCHPANKVYTD